MKKILFTMVSVLCANMIYAQITINATNTSVAPTGTVVHLGIAALTSVKSSPTPGAKQVWDFSAMQDSVPFSFSLNPNKNASFTSTELVDPGTSQTLFQGVNYLINNVYGEDANDLFQAGSYINFQGYDISGVIGQSQGSDSIYFPDTAIVYNNRQNLIAFPATYQSKWTNSYKIKLPFQLIIPIGGFVRKGSGPNNHCAKVSHISITDSVAGWGTLVIPSPNKASKPYNVLMVRRKSVAIDSFFINGATPSPLVLSALQVKEGQNTTDYSVNFYAAGRVLAMMSMDFGNDKTYSTPQSVNYTADSVQSGIENIQPLLTDFTLYPNPSSQNMVNCRFVKTTPSAWTLKMVNMLGQEVVTQTIPGIGSLNIPLNIAGVKSGLYVVNIIDENGNASSQPLSIVK